MAAQRESIFLTENCRVKIIKLKIKEGSNITIGQILFHFEPEENSAVGNGNNGKPASNGPSKNSHVVRATTAGLVEKLYVKEGDLIDPGTLVLETSTCTHPTVMKDMCAECGADLRESTKRNQTAAVAMVHNIPELMVSMKEAQSLGKADEERLLRDRKLVLLVDLDQTLIHTTNDEIPANIEDVFHFQLHGPNSPWYHTRLRPFTKQLLRDISSLYELHICTFGSRTYAHTIASFLDEEGRYFSHRILSRDECFSAHSKTANLKALFPCGDHMVVIIDDREDVWNFAPNLIPVRPYHFFQHTGDINAPPGLAKQEKDDEEGFDFTSLKSEESPATSKEKKDPSADSKVSSSVDTENNEKDSGEDENAEKALSTNNQNSTGEDVRMETNNDEVGSEKEGSKENINENPLDSNVPLDKQDLKESNSEECSLSNAPSEPAETGNTGLDGESEQTKGLATASILETEKCDKSETLKRKRDATDEDQPAKNAISSEEEGVAAKPIHIHDTDDYLLHLQDILRTIHHAYYQIYDDNCKQKEGAKDVPDMKKVLPYVRRKVLEDVNIVFSAVIPTNTSVEKSKPYLVAKSLGAVIMDRVTEKTTHVIAARIGTFKLNEAKKFKHIHVVTPDWLWSCAERWERVEERLYPLNSDIAVIRRKPPAHCTSPEVAFQLAVAASGKEEQDTAAPFYDRVTGKRVFRQSKRNDKGKSLVNSNIRIPVKQTQFENTVNPLWTLSTDEIADMGREVDEDIDADGGESDDDEEPMDYLKENDDEGGDRQFEGDDEAPPSRKRKLEFDHHLVIGNVIDSDSPENETLMDRFRRGESIPVIDGDEPDDEDSNEPEMDDLESDPEGEDSELCLAGQALEREFLSEED